MSWGRVSSIYLIAVFFCALSFPAGGAHAAEPTSGPALFTDDFANQTSGWPTGSLPSGATFAYGSGEYLITASAGKSDYAGAPYVELHSDIAVTVDMQSPAASSVHFGGGIVCGRPNVLGSAYVFKVYSDGVWAVLRTPMVEQAKLQPIVDGQLSHGLGPGSPITVTAVCGDRGSASGGAVTHLSMVVDGFSVANLDDTWSALSGSGWRAGLTAGPGTEEPLQAVHFTKFVLRDATATRSSAGGPSAGGGNRLTVELIVAGVVAAGLGSIVTLRHRSSRADAGLGEPSWIPESAGGPGIPPGPTGDSEAPPRPDG